MNDVVLGTKLSKGATKLRSPIRLYKMGKTNESKPSKEHSTYGRRGCRSEAQHPGKAAVSVDHDQKIGATKIKEIGCHFFHRKSNIHAKRLSWERRKTGDTNCTTGNLLLNVVRHVGPEVELGGKSRRFVDSGVGQMKEVD